MKKPNRIARNCDSAPSRAQVKREPSKPAKSTRKAAPLSAVPAKKTNPSPEVAIATAIGLEESPHGEYVCEVEHGLGVSQTLYRRGENEFTLVDICLTVRAGRYWLTWEEWTEIHPGISPRSLPPAKLRTREFPEKLHRGEVIAWLWDNLGSVAIPADFAEDFRPLCIVPPPSKAAVRESFFALAQTALNACHHAEDRASVAMDIRNVAMALGYKDEAAEAATIVHGLNASTIAASVLDDMITAGLALKA